MHIWGLLYTTCFDGNTQSCGCRAKPAPDLFFLLLIDFSKLWAPPRQKCPFLFSVHWRMAFFLGPSTLRRDLSHLASAHLQCPMGIGPKQTRRGNVEFFFFFNLHGQDPLEEPKKLHQVLETSWLYMFWLGCNLPSCVGFKHIQTTTWKPSVELRCRCSALCWLQRSRTSDFDRYIKGHILRQPSIFPHLERTE